MAEKKVIELEIKTESVGSLKSQLRQAQAEVAALSEKFGATSQEAINAAKKAAELKDAIADAKALTDAYNPDAKFNALATSIGGVLNGFQAFEGALGLVGVESEAVQEQLLKVQSAMALAEGVNGVMESVEAFKNLGAQIKSVTIVQKLLNLAMKANPIALLIAGITALIAVGYKLVSWWYESAAATEKANASLDRHTKALERQEKQLERSSKRLKDANQYQYDYAAAAGASSEQLRKLALKHQEEELALAKKNLELAKSTYLREQDILASYRANDASEELLERQTEIVKKAREATTNARESLTQEYDALKALRRQQKVEIRQEETDANKEAKDREKESSDKRLQAQKDAAEKRKEIRQNELEDQKKIADEKAKFELEQIELEETRQEQAYQRKLDAAEKAAEEEKAQEDKYRAEKLAQEEADEQKQEAAWKREQEGIEKLQELKYQAVLQGLTLISDLSEVFGKKGEKQAKKAFQIQKAASIASALISTYQSAVSAYQSQFVPLPDPTSPIRGAVAAGIAVAAGLGSVAKISSQKFEGGGGSANGGGGNITAPAGGGSAITPNFNIVGNAQATNPLAGLGGQPLQAYVVSGEVTTAQSLDRNRVNYATFG
jgi:hypothetical protein